MDLLGTAKSGFRLRVEGTPTRLILRSQPDPALLYLVVGVAVLLGLFGAALGASDQSVLEAGVFAALCSPIGLFLAISAVRLRASCRIDLERDEVLLREHRYLGRWERRYSLDQVGSVLLLATPTSGPLGTGRRHLLCLAVPDGAYVLGEASHSAALEPIGRVLARFLGVPLERHERTVASTGAERRRLVVGVLLYAVPVTAAVTLLGLSIPERPSGWVFLTILSAIALSQVGAILALLYYRVRTPMPVVPETVPGPNGEMAAVSAGEADRPC